jgi:hypothetical protein
MNTAKGLFENIQKQDRLQFWRDDVLDYKKVTDYLNFSAQDVSRIAGVSKASVRFDDKIPTVVSEHLASIANICNLVFEYFDDDVKTALWFKTPNPILGAVTPRDMIRYGRYKKLLRFVTDAMAASREIESVKKNVVAKEETPDVSRSA